MLRSNSKSDYVGPPNHKRVSVSIGGITDIDGDMVSVTITKISQDEPTNGLGDGDKSLMGQVLGHLVPKSEQKDQVPVMEKYTKYHFLQMMEWWNLQWFCNCERTT